MAKRRTRKQKESAKHKFKTFEGKSDRELSLKKSKFKPGVKRQFKSSNKHTGLGFKKKKIVKNKVKVDSSASVKADIVKSLLQTGAILALELVLYFVLKFQKN